MTRSTAATGHVRPLQAGGRCMWPPRGAAGTSQDRQPHRAAAETRKRRREHCLSTPRPFATVAAPAGAPYCAALGPGDVHSQPRARSGPHPSHAHTQHAAASGACLPAATVQNPLHALRPPCWVHSAQQGAASGSRCCLAGWDSSQCRVATLLQPCFAFTTSQPELLLHYFTACLPCLCAAGQACRCACSGAGGALQRSRRPRRCGRRLAACAAGAGSQAVGSHALAPRRHDGARNGGRLWHGPRCQWPVSVSRCCDSSVGCGGAWKLACCPGACAASSCKLKHLLLCQPAAAPLTLWQQCVLGTAHLFTASLKQCNRLPASPILQVCPGEGG